MIASRVLACLDCAPALVLKKNFGVPSAVNPAGTRFEGIEGPAEAVTVEVDGDGEYLAVFGLGQ